MHLTSTFDNRQSDDLDRSQSLRTVCRSLNSMGQRDRSPVLRSCLKTLIKTLVPEKPSCPPLLLLY